MNYRQLLQYSGRESYSGSTAFSLSVSCGLTRLQDREVVFGGLCTAALNPRLLQTLSLSS